MIRRSNNPVVLHLTDHSAYVALKEENVKLGAENERLRVVLDKVQVDVRSVFMNADHGRMTQAEELHRKIIIDIRKALRGADEKD